MKQSNFFKGLKVVELASVLAGPSVGMFFAELGAEVIKIENKLLGGDVTRTWKLASEDPNHPFSAYYGSVNWGKKTVFLDLHDSADFKKALELIQEADVVILNFKPGDALKLGVDYSSLSKLNPKLIYGEITGFGDSPRLAYDMVLQAETGLLSINGMNSTDLVKLPIAFVDLFAAHQLKEGILLAYINRERTGKGSLVSVSLFDSALASLTNQSNNWLMGHAIPQPMGMLHPNIAPYGERYKCKDGKEIVLAVGSNSQFKALCLSIGISNLLEDKRFQSNSKRILNRLELDELLELGIRNWNRDELMKKFIENKVPAGAIRNIKEVFDLDETQQMILSETKEGKELKALKGNAFNIKFT